VPLAAILAALVLRPFRMERLEPPEPFDDLSGCPAGAGRTSGAFRNAGCRRPLGLPDELVGEGDAVTDCLGIDEAHRFLVAGLAEQSLACPEHDREDHRPQLVDQIVLD
jgi:hypothetical protein